MTLLRLWFGLDGRITRKTYLLYGVILMTLKYALDAGAIYLGDEFGPFLVHVSASGAVLSAPAELPNLRSPDHPHVPAADASVAVGTRPPAASFKLIRDSPVPSNTASMMP